MQTLNRLAKIIQENVSEIWLALLLFLALPVVIALYTDYRGFLASTFAAQAIVLTLFMYKGNR